MDAEDSVRQAYEAYYRRLVTQVCGLVGDLAEAEDAVHEAFARVLAAPRSFLHADDAERWLRVAALNVARTRYRPRWLFDRLIRSGSASPATSPADPATPEPLWITSDAGRTWRQAAADTQPTAAVLGGTRPVDCDLLRISTCAIGVIDSTTGRFAPSAGRPTAITVQPGWARQVNVPLDGRLWVPGLDPATNKPAVAISSDAGRTWHTHVFTDGVAAAFGEGSPDSKYLPHVAAGSGDTAYVLTYRADDVVDAHYTTDGGMTWRAGDTIRDVQPSVGFVTADGSHVVGMGTGLVAARGTGRYTPVELPGYESPTQAPPVVSRPAADRYLVISEHGPYLSADGRIWERVRLP
jgi:hypothetical protein